MTQEQSFFSETTVERRNRPPALAAVSMPPFRLLLVVTTAGSSSVIELEEGEERTVGRAAPADIVLPDPGLSRVHARLRREGESVRLTDLGSKNGTWLDGERVAEGVARVGETFVLSQATVTVQLAPPPMAATLGLASAGSIVSRLEEECARARTFGRPVSVLIARGQRRGQLHATDLSVRCAQLLRPSDRLGVYDRDAVIAVLPETAPNEATQLAERLLRADASAPLTCGVAGMAEGESSASAEQLVAAALGALHSASPAQPLALAGADKRTRSLSREQPLRISAATRQLQRQVERLAPAPITVLIHGETGTGKELIARELHERSPRAQRPLKVVNCGAIPSQLIESVLFGHVRGAFTGALRDQPGLFTQAHGGTLFLDEVGELSSAAQAALLRVLDTRRVCAVGSHQEQQVDVRVVAATHRDLAAMAREGTFRLDLFHRLNSVVLRVPPLRERPDEILPLFEHFLRLGVPEGRPVPELTDAVRAQLQAYAWPGNVRELRNVAERALALFDGGCITEADLPAQLCASEHAPLAAAPLTAAPAVPLLAAVKQAGLRNLLREQEASIIEAALQQSGGNQRRAAERLHVPLRTLERKLRQLRRRPSTRSDCSR